MAWSLPALVLGLLLVAVLTAFYSQESLRDLEVKAAEEVVRVLRGEQPLNPVNSEALAVKRVV